MDMNDPDYEYCDPCKVHLSPVIIWNGWTDLFQANCRDCGHHIGESEDKDSLAARVAANKDDAR